MNTFLLVLENMKKKKLCPFYESRRVGILNQNVSNKMENMIDSMRLKMLCTDALKGIS